MSQNYRKPITKHGTKTFLKIINTAKKLFAEKGYNSTSINKIIEESKIATGTFYIYFDDKLSLYKYILEDYKEKIREHIKKATINCKTRYELEREGIKAFIEFAYVDHLSYNIIWESLFIDRTIFQEYYTNFASRYVAGLNAAKENGELQEIDLETLSYILMGISNFVGLQVIFKKHNNEKLAPKDIDFYVDQIMLLLKRGVFTNKHYEESN